MGRGIRGSQRGGGEGGKRVTDWGVGRGVRGSQRGVWGWVRGSQRGVGEGHREGWVGRGG